MSTVTYEKTNPAKEQCGLSRKTIQATLRLTPSDEIHKTLPMLEMDGGTPYPPIFIHLETFNGDTMKFKRTLGGWDIYEYIGVESA